MAELGGDASAADGPRPVKAQHEDPASRANNVFGVDIGGTFTDIVLLTQDGRVRTKKVPSISNDYSQGIVHGLLALIGEAGLDPAQVRGVVHGTTVATNAILEARGALTGLITTRGFRDVLEMRRLRIPQMYNLQYTPPRPLAQRRLRLEVDERMGPRGEIWRPLDDASVVSATTKLLGAGVEAVAVALINSYANPAHERRVGEIVLDILGSGVHLTLSSDILPEIREYERTSTAVVNAYVGPVVRQYLARLDGRLRSTGITAPLRIMQSNGGVMAASAASARPAYIIESGPAAGVIAAASVARHRGIAQVISLDMGGTTAKAALIEAGEPARTTEFEVGAGINLSSKLVKGGGHAVKLPYIDISEIGAGGGSIISVDPHGALRVGPRSAGSQPGPACYGKGGVEPTYTDAMVVLGYLNPEAIAGGSVRLRAELAHEALARHVGGPLGLPAVEAAWGAYAVAASNMTRAVKAVSTYRGRDPRDFALMAFGGNGPLAAVEIARALRIAKIIVPPACGVFSAFGLLCADIAYGSTRTLFRPLLDVDPLDADRILADLQHDTQAALLADDVPLDRMTMRRTAEMRYTGQAFELSVRFPGGTFDRAALAAAFHDEHERTYGHASPEGDIDLVSVKVTGRAPAVADASSLSRLSTEGAMEGGRRRAYFGPRAGYQEVPVMSRRALAGKTRQGPAIIEEYDTTCVVPPDATVRRAEDGSIEIHFEFVPSC